MLNAKWLKWAFVLNPDGSKFGTVYEVAQDGDTLGILSKGVKSTASAKNLDAQGLLSKPNAVNKKFVRDNFSVLRTARN